MICRHLLQHDDCLYCLREQVAALRAQLSDALDVIDAIEQGVSWALCDEAADMRSRSSARGYTLPAIHSATPPRDLRKNVQALEATIKSIHTWARRGSRPAGI